jgi:hypothetical protein
MTPEESAARARKIFNEHVTQAANISFGGKMIATKGPVWITFEGAPPPVWEEPLAPFIFAPCDVTAQFEILALNPAGLQRLKYLIHLERYKATLRAQDPRLN